MLNRDSTGLLKQLLLLAALGITGIFAAQFITTYPPVFSIGIAASLLVGLITLTRPDIALFILIFSMLLSPEITLAELPKRAVVIRIDDLLLVTIFFVWLVKSALIKGIAFFVKTPINRPIFVYTTVCIIATAKGILVGDISFFRSSFYVLKYIEYFFLYILVSNLITDREQLKKYLWAGAITAGIVTIYAYAHIGKVPRLYAPFDFSPGGAGESATLGGYLMIVMSLSLAYFTQAKKLRSSVGAVAFFLFMLPPFALTFSRSSYMAITVSLIMLVFFAQRKRLLLGSLTLLGIILVPILLPEMVDQVMERLRYTFSVSSSQLEMAGRQVGLEASAAQRVLNWRYAFTKWLPNRPFLGHGITGVGLVDAQYPLVLGETGLLGFISFLWLLATIFRKSLQIFRESTNVFDRGLALGFFAAAAGLCTQAFTANTFIIVRLMEPFWFLAAAVMRIPHLEENLSKEKAKEKSAFSSRPQWRAE